MDRSSPPHRPGPLPPSAPAHGRGPGRFRPRRVLPAGLEDVSKLPNLTEELLRRGYIEVEVEKILGGNVLRVMRDVEETAARLAGETPPVDRLLHRGAVGDGDADGGGGR